MKRIGLIVAILLALSGCETGGAVSGAGAGGRGQTDEANSGENAASISPQPRPARPLWINSLQMISASTGWALVSTANPANSSGLDVARTSDGGRTWALITPPSARADISAGQALLYVTSAQRAWIVGVTGQTSVVFGTINGGRSWSRSAPLAGAEPVAVAFAGTQQGWLLESMGAAMAQNPVRLFRSSDGGRSWSLAASSSLMPSDRPSGSGLPVACDKTGVAADPGGRSSEPSTGWITSYCPGSLTDAVLVSHDGGAHWAGALLPIPPSVCEQSGCEAVAPQFAGRTTFLVIWSYPDQALLLSTTDAGATWRTVIIPAGAGSYPRVRFFGPRDGIAVSAGPQGLIGRVFYRTSDGGRTWQPVVQGRRFRANASGFDFVSPTTGFAWTTGAEPLVYQTSNSGRSWATVMPRLG
jgi:photosystem II stability/assembly factor-like uncharacterized protein